MRRSVFEITQGKVIIVSLILAGALIVLTIVAVLYGCGILAESEYDKTDFRPDVGKDAKE